MTSGLFQATALLFTGRDQPLGEKQAGDADIKVRTEDRGALGFLEEMRRDSGERRGQEREDPLAGG